MSELHAMIASGNAIKQLAATDALTSFYPTEHVVVDLCPEPIASGVRDQPLSLEETTQGVRNRLNFIKQFGGYSLYIAIEGGAYKVDADYYESACAGVYFPDTKHVSIGYGPGYPIPSKIARHLAEGLDLNQAMEIETGIAEIGKMGGFNGWLTDGAIDRRRGSSEAVLMALFSSRHE